MFLYSDGLQYPSGWNSKQQINKNPLLKTTTQDKIDSSYFIKDVLNVAIDLFTPSTSFPYCL